MTTKNEDENNQAEKEKLIPENSSLNKDIELDLGEYFLHIYLEQSQGLDISETCNVKIKIEAMA